MEGEEDRNKGSSAPAQAVLVTGVPEDFEEMQPQSGKSLIDLMAKAPLEEIEFETQGEPMTDKPTILVAVCTHNSNPVFLAETLQALAAQTLPKTEWRFLLVDNASTTTTAREADLAWHPQAQYVVESTPGLTAARGRVFREANRLGVPLILFVDDDNVLAPDYLEQGVAIARDEPRLACWGGQLVPRFERQPEPWFPPFAKYLALFELEEDMVNDTFRGNHDVLPAGAGMFIRPKVGDAYFASFKDQPLRKLLGVNGKDPMRGEDTDLGLYALAQGWKVGRFQRLKLTHITPKGRTSAEYVARVLEGTACSDVLIRSIRGDKLPNQEDLWGCLRRRWRTWRLPHPHGLFYAAECRGRERGLKIVLAHAKR